MRSVVHALSAAGRRRRPGLIAIAAQLRPLLLAVVFVGAGMAIAVTSDYDPRNRLVAVTIQACLAVAIGALALLWHLGGRWLEWAADATAAAASAFPAIMITVALHGSTYAIGGLGVAQSNRTPAVARYIDTWHLVDYSYEGLPAFYPPLMPWIVGRTASMFDLTAPFALKLAGIAMAFMASLLAYLLWQRLLSRPLAALVPVAIIALVSVTPSQLLQPDKLLSLSLIIPWWLDAIVGVRREGVRRWSPWSYGVVGALIFCVYSTSSFLSPYRCCCCCPCLIIGMNHTSRGRLFDGSSWPPRRLACRLCTGCRWASAWSARKNRCRCRTSGS